MDLVSTFISIYFGRHVVSEGGGERRLALVKRSFFLDTLTPYPPQDIRLNPPAFVERMLLGIEPVAKRRKGTSHRSVLIGDLSALWHDTPDPKHVLIAV